MAPINPAADFYDNLGIRYEKSFGHDEGLIAFITESLSLLPATPNTTVLDIGSGTGIPTSSLVVNSGRKLYGIDFSPVMIELSRRQVPGGTFKLTNMLEFSPESPSQFQGAFAIFSLFHFSREEMDVAAERMSGWIAPGGYIFIGTMVAEDFPTEPHMFDEDGECARGIEHTFMGKRIGNLLYTRKGWENLLRKVGFEVVKTEMVPFQAPPDAECDIEPHYYITARKNSDG
ncbi:similar to type 11 methyltransferase [Botrytis cinerea T4]|uniref:phosphoethanolamine N-methyltransferase n=1 Tax=Botryotinia fuckeliana (strain T4) TaxID=999810 RepID=G2YQ13_BOTF4|nr:similar to type 11 methyltransferase [Botrytis cinerea T4]